VLSEYEREGLGKTATTAPLFLKSDNLTLQENFSHFEINVTNPYFTLILWTKAQALELEAVLELI
jgi:hypothetical protein